MGKEGGREGEEQNEGKESPINPGTLTKFEDGNELSVPAVWLGESYIPCKRLERRGRNSW